MQPRTALVVGNGLTLDLIASVCPMLRANWHPSRPLSWDVRVEDGRPARECLPKFFAEVDALHADDPAASDFTLIDRVAAIAEARRRAANASHPHERNEAGFAAALLDTELRHFLGIAYSALDLQLAEHCPMTGWRWMKYVERLGDSLLAVLSFNYETALERMVSAAGIEFFHCGIEPQHGLPLGKPHGSVDYAMHPSAIVTEPPTYPPRNAISLMNVPMVRLGRADLSRPRLHVEVVPPMAASKIRNYQWVWPIFDAFRQLGPAIERCVLLGVSGWPVDQPELCDVLRVLNPATEVVVANPDLRARITLDFHVRRLGLRPTTWWRSGPDA
ncbi:MAG: hypothetical protein ACXVS6_08490 [Solirubrobacteraceae bacterium]